MQLVDPTHEQAVPPGALAPRPTSLTGAVVGIVSNGKANTGPLFDHLERLLLDRWRVAGVVRLTKPDHSAPASDELMRQTAGWAALFAGIGD